MRRNSIHRIDIAILAVALAGYLLVYKISVLTWADLFWDFDVYQRAVTDAVLGADPYRHDAGFPFLYHPAVLYAFMLADHFVGLVNAFAGLCAVAVLIFLWGYKSVRLSGFRSPLREDASLGDKAIALAVVFSVGASLGSIFTGNITLYLHLALIGSTLAYVRQRSAGRRFLMLAIFSCTLLVKPYFLAYALPLLLIDRFSFRAGIWLAASMLASAAVYLLFWVFYNAHTMLFIDALNHLMNSSSDLADSSFGLWLRFLPVGLALKIHIAVVAVLALLVFFLRRVGATFADTRDNDGLLFLLAYVLMSLCSPRLKNYDLAPAFICLYLYLSCQGLFGRSIILLSLLIVQVPLWAMLYFGPANTPAALCALNQWDLAGVVLPLAIFLCWQVYCAVSNKRVPIAAS